MAQMRKDFRWLFQSRVHDWMIACFGSKIATDIPERNHRFVEEALELAQANGCTKSEVLQLVDYVYSRPPGQVQQEVGGVTVTLSALCTALGVNMDACSETELRRVWKMIDQIRAKHAAKPQFSPLPGVSPDASTEQKS